MIAEMHSACLLDSCDRLPGPLDGPRAGHRNILHSAHPFMCCACPGMCPCMALPRPSSIRVVRDTRARYCGLKLGARVMHTWHPPQGLGLSVLWPILRVLFSGFRSFRGVEEGTQVSRTFARSQHGQPWPKHLCCRPPCAVHEGLPRFRRWEQYSASSCITLPCGSLHGCSSTLSVPCRCLVCQLIACLKEHVLD